MAQQQHTASILSTHSGHHRIFIGPVVQRQTNAPGGAAATSPRDKKPAHSHGHSPGHSDATAPLAPKPWWEQGSSFLRSHLSLHHTTPTASASPLSSHSTTAPSSSARPGPIPQTKIPQFSYTFSDDSSTDESFDDQEEDAYDSEDEQHDYEHDLDSEDEGDITDDDDLVSSSLGRKNKSRQTPFQASATTATTSSLESLSAPVGQSTRGPGSGAARPHPSTAVSSRVKGKGKAEEYTRASDEIRSSLENSAPRSTVLSKGPSKKKKTKSMRDEGEPSGFKKLLGNYRERRHHQGMLHGPDLGWESDGSKQSGRRIDRQATSGVLTTGHYHDHEEHHPVLVSSPMSSEIDLPGALQPTVASSDERPDPRPIQNLPPKQDYLSPKGWNPHSSNTSLSSGVSPRHNNIQRGETWVTAREYASSIGHSSVHEAIEEEDEPEDEEDDHDYYSLAKATSRESDFTSAAAGVGTDPNQSRIDNIVEDLGIGDADSLDTKEPLSSTLTKASTRFGRALLRRAPTGLKRQDEETLPKKTVPQAAESICTIDKDCQKSPEHLDKTKHVRFLTKVQMSSSRQSTMLNAQPVIRQDRMLVRKEMTERPGPHVYNSDTARRLERQSQGWKEWWCVLKGLPVGPKPPVTKIKRKSKGSPKMEKGRLEFYYNHKKIKGTIILSSVTTVSVYSSLDYSIALTQNCKEDVGVSVYILRPRTYSLACAWYMEIYTVLHGAAPIPSYIEIAVPDFDVKIRVPIPEDSESETDSDSDESSSSNDERAMDTSLASLPQLQPEGLQTLENETPLQSFKTARTTLPDRISSKTFYLTNEDARPTLVAPDEVTPKLLRSHALSLLAEVPDWSEVVKMWQDPSQYGDVALCWKRYDRIEWIYWDEKINSETDNIHLKKDHIGFADGSQWSGRMDPTVVGPQVLDKTHLLELRPITHYPTKARQPNGQMAHEPDPIEGYLVRVSTFSGNPIRRFRRLYLTSHDHMLIYTIPSKAHSPSMQHAGSIDPTALMFCISPHRSANPDHKDMAQSRSIRRLKSQVRSARGFIDMTQIECVRVLSVKEWNSARYTSYMEEKKRGKENKRGKISSFAKRVSEAAEEARAQQRAANSQAAGTGEPPQVIMREPDNYFFPTIITEPPPAGPSMPSNSNLDQQWQQQYQAGDKVENRKPNLDCSEPLHNSLTKKTVDGAAGSKGGTTTGTFRETIVKSATFMADLLLQNDHGIEEDEQHQDSNVIEIEMKNGPCVRFRCFNPEAAHLWRDQLEKLATYWRLRKHLDVRDHMQIAQANYQLASSLDDDEIQVGETIQDWDNDRAAVSPETWNWCVVNGCRSVTKSGCLYYKPKLHKTFRKMYLVLTEGYLMLFHPHRRSKASGHLIPTTACKLFGIHSLMDIYVYSGHFSDEDTTHGTNDESERLPRFYPDGLIVDDPDEDCTFSIWRGKRKKMFSRRGGLAATAMASRSMEHSSSRLFGKSGLFKGLGQGLIKDGVVYGSTPQSCGVFRARSRGELEEWVFAINTEIERVVRQERKRIRNTLHS